MVKPKRRRILVSVTDKMAEAFADFRRTHPNKSWSDAKLVDIFTNTGIDVWRHEDLDVREIPAVVELEKPSFLKQQPQRFKPEPKPVAFTETAAVDDKFPFEDML